MKCCVAICRRGATIVVVFRTSPTTEYAFCQWHAIDRRGDLRWKPKLVAHAATLKGAG